MQQPGREFHPDRTRSLAMLGSLCLFLSAVEYLIPKPLPFMRIGLANLPLLLALDIFGPGDFFLLALVKVLGQGLIGGTLFSYVFLFSLAGTFSSALIMFLLNVLLGKKRIGFTGIGCAGAMISNGVQLLLARYFIFGLSLRYLAPPFLASGFITGCTLGIICEYFSRCSRWYAAHVNAVLIKATPVLQPAADTEKQAENAAPTENAQNRRRLNRSRRWNDLFDATALFITGILMVGIFLSCRTLVYRIVQFAFFCLLAFLSGKKVNIPATAVIMATIVIFNLLSPFGKVLAAIGPLRITQGSLISGLEKAFTLEGLLMLSRVCIKSDLRLPGKIGSLLSQSLQMLELMRERKNIITKERIVTGIDSMMLELEKMDFQDNRNVNTAKQGQNAKSIVLLSIMVIISAVINVMMHYLQR